MKRLQEIYLVCIIYLVFSYLTIICHGFGSNTLIELADGSKKNIYTSCLYSLRNTIFVVSYDIDQNYLINQSIKIGKKSTSNCYIRLGFDGSTEDDVICTPTQEFYVTARHNWVPAYLLKIGDALLTKDGTVKPITYKKFVPKSIKIYMLEIENTHTFFVGKHAILTHNIFLPLTASLGFVIPFGSVTASAAGSFFGPIGIVGGIAFGGLCSIVIKALYENRIPRYKTPDFNINYIENSCNKIYQNEHASKPSGCFTDQNSVAISCTFPRENQLLETPSGCFEIEIHLSDKQINICNKNEIEKNDNNRCFQQPEENNQFLYYSQEESSKRNKNIPTPKLTARNWKEFEENTPIGKKYGKKFLHIGKQNPKDGSPIRQLSEDIPNTEMFKKNYLFAPDRFHNGDHFEVWDKNGN